MHNFDPTDMDETPRTELEELLHQCAMTKAELGRKLDLNPTTISRWKGTPPQYVRAYLTMKSRIVGVMDELIEIARQEIKD